MLRCRPALVSLPVRLIARPCSTASKYAGARKFQPMAKSKKQKAANAIPESVLSLPAHASALELAADQEPAPVIDTHTHLLSTYGWYKSKYKDDAACQTIWDFVRTMCMPPASDVEADAAKQRTRRHKVTSMVDVWCEPASWLNWREIADSAVEGSPQKADWGGCEYWFAMGVHPHEAKHYDDKVEGQILEAMKHPRSVSWGEIGLDYHYSFSEHDVQQRVFRRQLQLAVSLEKPITIHTREAEEDTERIMKEVIPRDWKIHIHCFTDSPDFAERLLDHFPNLYIGITGVVTYTSNLNTSEILRRLAKSATSSETGKPLRILLETDAPYMTPSNIYPSLPELGAKNPRLPLCHPGMIPWTAEFVSNVVKDFQSLSTDAVLRASAANAAHMYSV
ncbi:Metallo-dependent hydrolase [Exidia glandulosa HHB12029]|uniref:Metallo-dependent hydrolase n=1 Tax=Exidia glandulosa HHB12029 TaxID=1314781 RepID=A0A165QA42_EXIGL|nr:Metallo-dependent hydrolase [Exidia glandulosa HHB12029]